MSANTYKISLKCGSLHINLPDNCTSDDTHTILCTYSQHGEPIFPKTWGKDAYGALYDLLQVDDRLNDGDEFTYRGRVVARVEGFHVVEVNAEGTK